MDKSDIYKYFQTTIFKLLKLIAKVNKFSYIKKLNPTLMTYKLKDVKIFKNRKEI